jgi:hypothetical protein
MHLMVLKALIKGTSLGCIIHSTLPAKESLRET